MTAIKNKLVDINKASEILGVCKTTLRNWTRSGKINFETTKGGHRRFYLSDVIEFKDDIDNNKAKNDKVVIYCRVSSHDQKKKGDLERQVGRVTKYCIKKDYTIIEILEEVCSGMSDNRPKLKKLFKLIENNEVDKVVVEHKDRLTRFMFNIFVSYFESYNVSIEYVEEILGKSYEEELVEDILSLMASFSSRIYGKRSAENRKNNN